MSNSTKNGVSSAPTASQIGTRVWSYAGVLKDDGLSYMAYVEQLKLVPQDPNDEPASVLLERIREQAADAPKPKRKTRKKLPMSDKRGNRDEFPAPVKRVLEQQAASRCCNPGCGQPTRAQSWDGTKSINIGTAAHIHAAAEGGARFDPYERVVAHRLGDRPDAVPEYADAIPEEDIPF